MYFKDKEDTSIDSEFNNDNVLSKILFFFFKYKLFIGIMLLIIFSIIVILFRFGNNNYEITDINYLVLTGDEVITIYKESDYVEPGYKAYNSKHDDLTKDVKISSNVNINVVGEYEIRYEIGDIVKIRKVMVIDKPKVYTFIRLCAIDNNVNVYLKLREEYVEPGYQVFSSTGENLNDMVVITGSVDTSKKGKYELKYFLVDENGVTVTVSRFVIVMDLEINLSLSISSYTNKYVDININVDSEFFDYIILPDGNKVSQRNYVYRVSSNGRYTFKTYSTKGMIKEKGIEVININRTLPMGSCSGSFENGISVVNINASDDIGIKKYEINGYFYTNNQIKLNKELNNVIVRIYDNADNVKEISCILKDNNKPVMFGNNIKLSYAFFKNDSMWYVLYSPNVDNNNKKIPLIVWLHGSGEVGSSENVLKNSGFLKVLNEWKLEGFNAYVLCPRLSSGGWNNKSVKDKLFSIIDKVILDKNIDTNKIIIVGHSLGGIGVQYMAYYGQDYFSSMVMLSGYDAGIDLNVIKNMPVRGYTEASGSSYTYTMGKFAKVFGQENVTVINTSHGNIPNAAFNEDQNGDGRSDLIEWMLMQE